MVKAVVGEETQLTRAEDRLSESAISVQVGLVIGKLSSALDRGFVFDLIPTPPNDAGEPACSLIETKDDRKKPSKSKSQPSDSSSLAIDTDWVAEHGRQVSRMLLGGMKVVGIYIWASDSAYKNSTIVLCQTMKAVAEAAPHLGTDLDERLLIHICYSPRRWACKTSNITPSSLRTCDFKMGRVLSSLQRFRCTYNFDIRLPIFHGGASSGKVLSDILRQGISFHAKALVGAKAVVDGNLVVNDEPCTSDGFHDVELFLPFMKDSCAEACSLKDVVGILLFSGSVCSYAYLHSKEPISQAVADIKSDIIRSLQSRLDIICDEADEDLGAVGDDGDKGSGEMSNGKPTPQLVLHLSRQTCCLSFPRRVFVPWLAGIFICDYLQSSESLEVLEEHCMELISMEATPDASTILEEESVVPSLSIESFWDAVVPFPSKSTSSSQRNTIYKAGAVSSREHSHPFNFNIVAAILGLLLSILLGLMLYVSINGREQ